MPVTQIPTRAGRCVRPLLLAFLILAACSKKQEEAPGSAAPVPPPAPSVAASPDPIPGPSADSLPTHPAAADVEASVERAVTAFRSRPSAQAWPGRPYVYRAAVAPARAFRLRVIEGPDSMRVEKHAVTWTPAGPGRHPVTLEARWTGEGGDSGTVRQAFMLSVEPVLSLSLKPLPARAAKGDTVVFDLAGTAYPAWAETSITVRFDYEGDGAWDTPALPVAKARRHAHAYARPGRFAPKVEARYRDLEVRGAEGAIAVISTVDARLSLSPDTVEPGGRVNVDASASKGDGALAYFLDLDGDGKTDWADSAKGRAAIKAPGSGRYQAVLTARNPMGQEGRATATLLVNARPAIALKIRNPRENMAAPVEVLVEAGDGDDSLRTLRVNFTGAKDAWISANVPDSSKGPRRWRKLFKQAYGKTGKFTVEGCAAAADGRETCRTAKVEIFNAPPSCEPGAEVKATLGVPAEIEGKGKDPDGSIVKWEWDLDGDGAFDVASKKDGKVKYTFARKGGFTMTLRVTSADGMTATAARKVEVRKSW